MSKRKNRGKHYKSRHERINSNSEQVNINKVDYNEIINTVFNNETIKEKMDSSNNYDNNNNFTDTKREFYGKEKLETMIEAIKNDVKEEKSKKEKLKKDNDKNDLQYVGLEKIVEELEKEELEEKKTQINKEKINEKTEQKNKKKGKFKSFIITLIQLILIGVMIYTGTIIYKWYEENKENNQIKEELSKVVEKTNEDKDETSNALDAKNYNIDFEKLKSINSDTVGWLKVNNTNIEYAVVKSKDNDFYLNHSFYKKENGAGWIFADYRNKVDGTDKNLIVYGHNRKDASMFGTLKDIFKKEWYEDEDNQTIVFITPNEKLNYRIFSIYQIEAEDYYISTGFNTTDAYKNFIKKLKSRSYYDFGVEVDENSSILTLSTCSTTNHRTVVHAKKVD